MTVTKLVEVDKKRELDFLMAVVASAIFSTLGRAMKVHAQLGLIGQAGAIALQLVMAELNHELVSARMDKQVIVRDLPVTNKNAINKRAYIFIVGTIISLLDIQGNVLEFHNMTFL